MQLANLLKLNEQELDDRISKEKQKIKNSKEMIQLLERLKNGAPRNENIQKQQNISNSNSDQQDHQSSNPYYGG